MNKKHQQVDREQIERHHQWNLQKLDAIEQARTDFDWPLFFVAGESDTDVEGFVECYYKVEGPNGPISYRTPDGDPRPTTVMDLVLEAQGGDVREVQYHETPWAPKTNKEEA